MLWFWHHGELEIVNCNCYCIKCRLCLAKCDRFIRLFGKAGRSRDYVSKIDTILGIKIVEGDGFSDVLCQKCTRTIDRVDVFKNKCF